jgi:hypothetical protein
MGHIRLVSQAHSLKITNSDLRKWVKKAIEEGWEVDFRKSNHILLINPANKASATIPTNKISSRTVLNYRSILRRAGLKEI